MHKDIRVTQLWLAFVMLTRLPLPRLPEDAFSQGARAVWAYPLVGLCIGGVAALVGQLAFVAGLPVIGAAALVLCTMMLMSGAMHEDGLADLFDGFWGGTTPARRLEIMRDSQIGTYGVLALVMVGILRLSAMTVLLEENVMCVLAAAAASRAMMPLCMYALPHARHDGLSHSVGRPSILAVGGAALIGFAILMIVLGGLAFLHLVWR